MTLGYVSHDGCKRTVAAQTFAEYFETRGRVERNRLAFVLCITRG
jgi:hypothetical protein